MSSDSNSHRLSEGGYDVRLGASSLTLRISSILLFRGSASSIDSFNCLPFSCGTFLLTEVILSCNLSSPLLACSIEFCVFSHCTWSLHSSSASSLAFCLLILSCSIFNSCCSFCASSLAYFIFFTSSLINSHCSSLICWSGSFPITTLSCFSDPTCPFVFSTVEVAIGTHVDSATGVPFIVLACNVW